jgi:hypothetical protein
MREVSEAEDAVRRADDVSFHVDNICRQNVAFTVRRALTMVEDTNSKENEVKNRRKLTIEKDLVEELKSTLGSPQMNRINHERRLEKAGPHEPRKLKQKDVDARERSLAKLNKLNKFISSRSKHVANKSSRKANNSKKRGLRQLQIAGASKAFAGALTMRNKMKPVTSFKRHLTSMKNKKFKNI